LRFLNPSGERQRQQLRESLLIQFNEMLRNNRLQRAGRDSTNQCKPCFGCNGKILKDGDSNNPGYSRALRAGNNGYNSHLVLNSCYSNKAKEKENNRYNTTDIGCNGTMGSSDSSADKEKDEAGGTNTPETAVPTKGKGRQSKKGKQGGQVNRRYKGKNRRC